MGKLLIDGLPWRDVMAFKLKFFEYVGYTPWWAQWKYIHNRPQRQRFLIQCWGRQSGKSYAVAHEILWHCLYQPEGEIWLVVPIYDLGIPIWQRLCLLTDRFFQEGNWDWYRTMLDRRDFVMEFSNGVRFSLKSATNPSSLQGRALRFLAMDECASIRDRLIWEQYLRPTVAVNKSRVLMISTPKGHDWFWEMYMRGHGVNRLKNKEYFSASVPSKQSPYMPKEEFLSAKRTLPERIFRQEWMAEFVSEHGGVFGDISECIKGDFEPPKPGRMYVAGIDLAKYQDYSVMVVMDYERKHVVFFKRWQKMPWDKQIELCAHIAQTYGNARCAMDSTGVGDPVADMMISKRYSMRVVPYDLHMETKQAMIDNLVLGIETRSLTFPKIDVLIDELRCYEYQRTERGGLRTGAPTGKNDDTVIALALAYWEATKGAGVCSVVHSGRIA